MEMQIPYFKLSLIVGALAIGLPQRTEALSGDVNGFGYGTATVQIWCAPNAPPAPPNYVDSHTGLVPTSGLGPNLDGCDPRTSGFLSGGSFWRWNQRAVAFGGDTVDDPDLLSLVVPSSTDAVGELFVSAFPTSANSATFTITWSGSDPGVAAYVAWYEGGNLLHEELRIGPWSETITVDITSTGPIEDVELHPSSALVSLP